MSEMKQFLFAIALVAMMFAVIWLAIDWLTDPSREPWSREKKLGFVVSIVVACTVSMVILVVA